MSDTNLFSFNGPDDNGKTVALANVLPPPGISSALKFSTGLRNLTLHAGAVTGGKDACVDVNNLCTNLDLTLAEAAAGGQFVSTIKGGSEGISLTIGKITKRGTVCEHIFGDWADQSHLWCDRCTLDSRMADGSAVRVMVLASYFPVLTPGSGPYRYFWWNQPWQPYPWHWLIVFGFETLRRWGFFRSEAN